MYFREDHFSLAVCLSLNSSLPTPWNSDLALGVMPKRGLDVSVCEVFRFYRLIAVKDLVEPLSMIVPRKEVGIIYLPYLNNMLHLLMIRNADRKKNIQDRRTSCGVFVCSCSQVFSKRIYTQ